MTEKDFISQSNQLELIGGSVTWQAPSNIALVKYWGKKEPQIPANPSISFTLDSCRTTTKLEFKKKETADKNITFEPVSYTHLTLPTTPYV